MRKFRLVTWVHGYLRVCTRVSELLPLETKINGLFILIFALIIQNSDLIKVTVPSTFLFSIWQRIKFVRSKDAQSN